MLRFNIKLGKVSSDIKKNQRGISNDDKKAGKSAAGAPWLIYYAIKVDGYIWRCL